MPALLRAESTLLDRHFRAARSYQQPVGIYTGSISITADQGSETIPVTLTVWNFELPVQPSELSLWTLWPPAPAIPRPVWGKP